MVKKGNGGKGQGQVEAPPANGVERKAPSFAERAGGQFSPGQAGLLVETHSRAEQAKSGVDTLSGRTDKLEETVNGVPASGGVDAKKGLVAKVAEVTSAMAQLREDVSASVNDQNATLAAARETVQEARGMIRDQANASADALRAAGEQVREAEATVERQTATVNEAVGKLSTATRDYEAAAKSVTELAASATYGDGEGRKTGKEALEAISADVTTLAGAKGGVEAVKQAAEGVLSASITINGETYTGLKASAVALEISAALGNNLGKLVAPVEGAEKAEPKDVVAKAVDALVSLKDGLPGTIQSAIDKTLTGDLATGVGKSNVKSGKEFVNGILEAVKEAKSAAGAASRAVVENGRKIEAATSELAATKAVLAETTQTLTSELASARAELRAAVEARNSTTRALRELVSTVEGKIAALQGSLETLERVTNTVEGENGLAARVTSVETSLTGKATKDEVAAVAARVSSVEAILNGTVGASEGVEAQPAQKGLVERVNILEAANKTLQETVAILSAALGGALKLVLSGGDMDKLTQAETAALEKFTGTQSGDSTASG